MRDDTKAKPAANVALATMIGTATEWYDYFLYGTASALVFEKLFFPNFSQVAGSMALFAGFGITLVVRPLGAAIFGHFGDRLGRKSMLAVSIFVMGIGTFLIGLLPTYSSIGDRDVFLAFIPVPINLESEINAGNKLVAEFGVRRSRLRATSREDAPPLRPAAGRCPANNGRSTVAAR